MSEQILLEGQILEGGRDASKRTIELDLIREGFGNPRDRHYYGADILEAYAESFNRAKMYINHQDPETARKLQGLPRPVQEIGGRIIEAWVDTNEEGKRVVRARAKIAQPWLWNLIEADPELLGVSINARGSSREGMIEGQEARIVESISKVLSVDFVTEAGAGGKIRELVEAQIQEAEEDETEVTPAAQVEETEEVEDTTVETEETDEPEEDEGEEVEIEVEEVEEEEDEQTEAELDADRGLTEDDWELVMGDEDELYTEAEVAELAEAMAAEKLREAVRAAVRTAREEFDRQLTEAQANFDKALAQRDQRYLAARMIEAAGFKAPSEKALKEQFYDVYYEAETDGDGNVVKSGQQVLEESVKKAIDEKRAELSAYVENRVTGAGESGASTSTGEGMRESAYSTPGGRVPKEAPLDKEIDSLLGIK